MVSDKVLYAMYDMIGVMPWIDAETVKIEDCKESSTEFSFEILYDPTVSSSAVLASPMAEVAKKWSGGRLLKFDQRVDYSKGPDVIRLFCAVSK